jgi:hypothetical protein
VKVKHLRTLHKVELELSTLLRVPSLNTPLTPRGRDQYVLAVKLL